MEKEIKTDQPNFFVVGVGSSAGGLESLRNFLSYLPKKTQNFAIVIAQHISPDYKSKMVDLLSTVCQWPVMRAGNNAKLEPGKVYVTPPDYEIKIANGKIRLKKHVRTIHAIPSIDGFFKSLAQSYKDHSIAVILSGTGRDGSEGVVKIKDEHGFVIVQPPEEASHPSMPAEAIDTGVVDEVCNTAQIADCIAGYIENFGLVKSSREDEKDSMAIILELMENRYRTDFSKYKPSTINRRVEKRINDLHLVGIDEYYLMIKKSPHELEKLFQTILIGVTDFFRDPDSFDLLREKIKERIRTKNEKQLRIWSVGCASGEEPYSIAIMIAEILGDELRDYIIQIFATDIDENALSTARKGYYNREALSNLPEEYLEKYFVKANGGFEVNKSIRHHVLFSKHDITNDPPFVKLDFVTCRNLLIYFKQELQKDIIPVFHYSLNPQGYLMLGKSENVSQVSNLFHKGEGKTKIFQRKDDVELNTLSYRAFKKGKEVKSKDAQVMPRVEMTLQDIAKETLLKTFEDPYVVLDEQMETCHIKGSLHPFLELSEGAINSNILKLVHNSLHIELRSLFSKVKKNDTSSKSNIIRFEAHGIDIYVQLVIKPLLYKKNQKKYFLLIFHKIDAEERYPFNKEMLSDQEFKEGVRIVELEQELSASREHLQTFTEELETSNEELQTLNEELQSSNEELKSTNEELETSNEELQSTNEELQTANAELIISNEALMRKENELSASRSELQRTNDKFEVLLANSNIFMAYQDLDLKYEWVYNQAKQYTTRDLYGYSDDQLFADKSSAKKFINLKKKVLATEEEIFTEIHFQGKYWKINVRPWYENGKLRGLLVVAIDITTEKSTLETLELRNKSINSLIEGSGDYVMIVNRDFELQVLSQRLKQDLMDMDVKLSIDESIKDAMAGKDLLNRKLLVPISNAMEGQSVKVEDYTGISNQNDTYHYSLRVFPIFNEKDEILGAALIGTEITNLVRTKNRTNEALKRGVDLIGEDYFKDLTKHLCDLFNCKYTYVGVVNNEFESIDTKAIRINRRLSSNFSYKLDKVPCAAVYNKQELQLFKNVAGLYPDDPKLDRWDAADYLGVPINSPTTGEVLGIIVLINDKEIEISQADEYLLTILSLKAGAELLREESFKALSKRDTQLRKISLNSPDVIYEFESLPDGTEHFTYVSSAIAELYELDSDEVLENPQLMYNALHPDDVEDFKKVQTQSSEDPKPLKWTGRIRTSKTEQIKWIKISSRPERHNDGAVLWYGVISDITSQKENEKLLEDARATAEEAAQAKENFLATMSHEIRTPLNAIYGVSELLQLEYEDLDYLKILKFSTDNLLALVNNVLDFSKIKAGMLEVKKHPVKIRKLLNNVADTLEFQAGMSENTVSLNLAERLPETVIGDELILTQVLNNLLSNANKFTKKGTIRIAVDVENETDQNLTVHFQVADTGVGIKSEELGTVFEKFEQATHNNGATGTGLGLTITKALIELMGSEIHVESVYGEGTRFYFSLTFGKIKDDRHSIKPKKKSQKRATAQSINILLVDDTEDNRTLILAYFKSKYPHIEFDVATNGEEAVDKVKSKKFDLVFMDVRMPKLNGDNATKIIRSWDDEYFKKLPIIAMSADTYGIDKSVGFTNVVTKPFKFRQVYAAIKRNIKKSETVE